MKKVGGLFTCSALALMAFAALPLSAAELAHRWSFNGDYSDSTGGADAVKCGTYVSLYGGRVHMGYGACSHGTGYVDLGTNMLDTTTATIEIWARHDGVESWSRVFDYGADNAHYFQMPWTNGTNLNKDSIGAKNGGGETQAVDTMAPYEIGTDYYIAATFQRSGDATVVRWQRRDAATGELQKSGTLTMPAGIHGRRRSVCAGRSGMCFAVACRTADRPFRRCCRCALFDAEMMARQALRRFAREDAPGGRCVQHVWSRLRHRTWRPEGHGRKA